MSEGDLLSEEECREEFARLFPVGPGSADLMSELAPDGWDHSLLRYCFHPTPERLYEEAVGVHERMEEMFPARDPEPTPAPTMADIVARHTDPPTEPQRELAELLGKCVWDVFSDNHEVITSNGRSFDLGSFRASGGFIADWLNSQQGTDRYDYMDFYMGTIWIGGRADLTPVYEAIFRRLHARGHNWVYEFPRLRLVDLRPLQAALGETQPDWEGYDPSRAFQQQQEDVEREREVRQMREQLDEAYREAVDKARQGPPPHTVAAYTNVYGVFPQGWPPESE
jgi:hypothetical protein